MGQTVSAIRAGFLFFLLVILTALWFHPEALRTASTGELAILLGCMAFPTVPIFGSLAMARRLEAEEAVSL